MKKLLQTIIDDLDMYVALAFGCGMTIAVFWFIYKIFAGAYALLDKLIDKL